MIASLTDTLCTRCGLCCDGTLFADVELAGRAEATRMESLGLEVEDDPGARPLLVQPCAALHGTRCSVYAHRPGCCRTFECRLLADTRAGRVSLASARARVTVARALVARARALLARLGAAKSPLPLRERAAEASANAAKPTPAAARTFVALATTMDALERTVREDFLPGAVSRPAGRDR